MPIAEMWEDWKQVSKIDEIENLNISTEMLLNKAIQWSLRAFSRKFKWEPCKVAKLHTNPYNFVARLPNPYKLSTGISDDVWRANHFAIFR